MGGIAGIVDFRPGAIVERESIERMCSLIEHRGRTTGIHVREAAGLGHRRLAITDLETGKQPLSNEDGTVWVTFNGEIYNFRALRAELEGRGHRFVTQTDTEVIPHLYEEHGIDFVHALQGNWAIGLWDERRRRLVLTRDRIGRRPLAWSLKDGVVRFASEVKAILADPAMSREIDQSALIDIIRFGTTVESRTMFRDVSVVKPSHRLVFEDGRLVADDLYWDCNDVPLFEGGFEEAIDGFTEVLAAATAARIGGDVPYGLLQSGGIDSSLLASFIAEQAPGLRTYTVATGGVDDETDAATAVARHVGAEHTVIPLSDVDPVEVAPKIPWMLDEPFMNDGLIGNLLLSRSLADEVTVAITGDGGDHAFSGTWVHMGDALAEKVPRPLAPVGALAADAVHGLTRNRTARRLSKGFHGARVPQRSRWLVMRQHDMPIRHAGLLATPVWQQNGIDPEAEALAYYDRCTAPDHLSRVIYAEARWDLPPNDMMKVDRACAYGGMAARSPYFDPRVVEFAASLPAEWKGQGRALKILGREVARRRLPEEISRLPKTGLSTPMRDWMRGPFGEKIGRVLASDSFASRGVFDPKGAMTVLERHRAGRGDYAHVAWTMAMTEIFYRSFVDTFGMADERVWE